MTDGLVNKEFEFGSQKNYPHPNSGPGIPAWETCDHLACAVRLLIQGVQSELTSRHGMPQPEAGNMAIGTILKELDDHVEFPYAAMHEMMHRLES